MSEIDQIKKAIEVLEAQRLLLGDNVVDVALAPLREKLANLQPSLISEQRRLITVLFADQVGFTAMSEKMDPEDVKTIVQAYYERWTPSIGRYGGTVEKFIGDAVLAVFGLLVGREDDPENAVRAALEMRQALAALNQEHQADWGFHLEMRTGIHTGPAIVTLLRETDRREFVALGDTLNLASRLQSVAPPGGILISHDTYRHVRGIFDVQVLEPVTVKGKEEPIQAYLVLRAKRRTFRTPSRGVEGIETKMIGRETELQRLKDALAVSMDQRKAQVVTISGEAGIGKSRLMAEFDNWVELLPQVVRYFKCRASPSMENLPYSLLRDLFSFRFQIQDSDPPGMVQEKLEHGLGEFKLPDLDRRVSVISHLLGFKTLPSLAQENRAEDPKVFRDMAVVYLIDYFTALASIRSIVLLLEDIHWADESSLEVLKQCVEGLSGQPLLVVCAARPTLFERYPGWGEGRPGSKVGYEQVELKPLSRQLSQRLVEDILQKVDQIPELLSELVVNRAEGNPFYLEELLKMLIEDGVILKDEERWKIDNTRLADLRPPTTLVEVLQSRLDSLSAEEKVLLQRASVIGRIFWDGAIRSMEPDQNGLDNLSSKVGEVLESLDQREMVFPNEASAFESTREFSFKHALLRDVTYESVLKRLRRVYHAFAAQWLESVTERSGRSNEYAALIADHYHHAGDPVKTRFWYEHAGKEASDRYANAEGIRCITHCLALWPEENLEKRYELLLRRVKLYDLVADREAQKRDLEVLQGIARKLDEAAQDEKISYLSEVSIQWWYYYEAMGELEASFATAQEAVVLAQSKEDEKGEAIGNLCLGATMWKKGEYPAARETLEKSLALARRALLFQLEGDVLRNLGIVYQLMGKLDEARANYEEAQRIYHETGNERGEGMVLNSLGALYMDQGQYREAHRLLEDSLEIKRKIGHRRAEHNTLYNLGLVASKLGTLTEARKYLDPVLHFSTESGDLEAQADAFTALGVIFLQIGDLVSAQMHFEKALLIYQEIGSSLGECYVLTNLGWLHNCQEEHQLCLQRCQEAITIAGELSLLSDQADALDFLGQALLNLGRAVEAENAFKKALEIWHPIGKGSRIMEVKTGLASASLAQNKQAEARRLIEEVLDHLGTHHPPGKAALHEIPYAPLEGMNEPFRALLACIKALWQWEDPRAGDLLDAAYRLLQEQASRLEVESEKIYFLERTSWHREILVEWKKRSST